MKLRKNISHLIRRAGRLYFSFHDPVNSKQKLIFIEWMLKINFCRPCLLLTASWILKFLSIKPSKDEKKYLFAQRYLLMP